MYKICTEKSSKSNNTNLLSKDFRAEGRQNTQHHVCAHSIRKNANSTHIFPVKRHSSKVFSYNRKIWNFPDTFMFCREICLFFGVELVWWWKIVFFCVCYSHRHSFLYSIFSNNINMNIHVSLMYLTNKFVVKVSMDIFKKFFFLVFCVHFCCLQEKLVWTLNSADRFLIKFIGF